jgi:hypothetical protein
MRHAVRHNLFSVRAAAAARLPGPCRAVPPTRSFARFPATLLLSVPPQHTMAELPYQYKLSAGIITDLLGNCNGMV